MTEQQANSPRHSAESNRQIVVRSFWLTVAFELLTCALRFGARLESTRDTASTIGRLTLGLRIHHSYIGLAMIPVAMWLETGRPKLSRWVLCVGLGLLFSDLIHHFIVLWLIVGSPQFDLFY